MAQPLRTTREYFLSDQDVRKLLGLKAQEIILEVRRSEGVYHGRAVGKDQAVDLAGCIVVVLVREGD